LRLVATSSSPSKATRVRSSSSAIQRGAASAIFSLSPNPAASVRTNAGISSAVIARTVTPMR
jgi:hypothetical protein